jgi:hypothetical protein
MHKTVVSVLVSAYTRYFLFFYRLAAMGGTKKGTSTTTFIVTYQVLTFTYYPHPFSKLSFDRRCVR